MKLSSPIGPIKLHATYCGLQSVTFIDESAEQLEPASNTGDHPLEQKTAKLLGAYFEGEFKTAFNLELPLYLRGTAFQVMVWNALLRIPYGDKISYQEFAASFGAANAVRAVGAAIGKNPLPIIIPCHRVIRSSGRIEGYKWGSVRKSALIGWEGVKKGSGGG